MSLWRTLFHARSPRGLRSNKAPRTLHQAAATGDTDVVKLLLAKGADVNAKEDDGWTPLHWAARNGHKAVANC
jgi:ankyrin repeat protein